MEPTFCCMECRLLQKPATTCRECSSPTIGALATQTELLKYRNMAVAEPADAKSNAKLAAGTIGGIAAYFGLAFGAVLWVPLLPIAVGATAGVGAVFAWHRARSRIVSVPLCDPVVGKTAETRTGIARRLADSLPAFVPGEAAQVLAEEVVIRNLRGVLFRRVASVPFLVELADGKLVVDGVLRLGEPADQPALVKHDPRLAALGIPALRIKGKVGVATIRDGDRVTVTGVIRREAVAALAFHRDAGDTDVARGEPGAVVLVERAKT